MMELVWFGLGLAVGSFFVFWSKRSLWVAQQEELNKLREENKELIKTVVELKTRQEEFNVRLQEEREQFTAIQEKMRLENELAAQKIMDAKLRLMEESNQRNIQQLLIPLKEQLAHFAKSIDERYQSELRERFSLKHEIERLIQVNDRMMVETQSLTQALRGDIKIQGDWGELVLQRILEESGLREGHEYLLQKDHQNEEGDHFRPDVVILLPEDKHLIVDAKVSLGAYEQYRSYFNDPDKAQLYAREHVKSIERHIDNLSQKHYARLKGVRSPEFVFLFIPIEAAYLVALQTNPSLSSTAWKKGVALVTSTTLMTSLKTVSSIWRLEKQNRNALEIAAEGGRLYDKFVLFFEEFEKMGKTLGMVQKQYYDSLAKLKEGPGNIFKKIERLKELGAHPTRQLRQDLVE
ncbi:MAG: DNA recombination protein RmuC [Bdellovibrionaceae bacterium]|nr:DNA recombination protein RmuC [Pseudobdellovibrionaceae bacterium]MDW8190129.1 DNA recombination protein RmuC [Pseudobdellovibrionaceae bacterium]